MFFRFWHTSEVKSMKHYHDLYLKYNILLLDVLEKFRNNSLKNYELCRSHYLSALALKYDAMLNMTKVGLELVSDASTYMFFEKDMRSPVS